MSPSPALLALTLAPALLAAQAPAPDADFPAQPEPPKGIVLHEPGALAGYTLISPLSSVWTYLVDMQGAIVHRWETELAPAGGVYLLPNGHLLRCGRESENPRFRGGGIGGRIQEFDWDGKLVWDYELGDDYQTQHHDVEPLPNGNVLTIVWEHRFREDAIAFGRDPAAVGEAGMWPDAVLELKPLPPDGAEVVWEWHVWDHLVQDHDPDAEGFGVVADRPGRLDVNADHRDQVPVSKEEAERLAEMERQMRALGYVGDDGEEEEEEEEETDGAPAPAGTGTVPDWLHTNGISYHPGLDLIVLSTPQLGELWVIDHGLSSEDAAWDDGGRWGRGGELLWRWGNPRTHGAGTDEDKRLFYQHDPTWVHGQDGELRLLVYNNGGGRPDGDYSTVEELVLPFDPERGFLREPGEAFGPAQPAWIYRAGEDYFSGFISGAQRLANGNTLICAGAPGRVYEVTPAGRIVWDFVNPFRGEVQQGPGGSAPPTALFRATRITPDHPGLAGRL